MVTNPIIIGDWRLHEWHSFQQISRYYGAAKTRRTRLPLINHIVEGVVLIHQLGGSPGVADAFCWHPLIQSDATYVDALTEIRRYYNLNTNGQVLVNVLGYRDAANRWLRGSVSEDNQPKQHPLADVNIMLMADKIQNRKDFENNEAQFTAEHVSSLHYYFDSWFSVLGISPEIYLDQIKQLSTWIQANSNSSIEDHKP